MCLDSQFPTLLHRPVLVFPTRAAHVPRLENNEYKLTRQILEDPIPESSGRNPFTSFAVNMATFELD